MPADAPKPELILASASPRRRQLLNQLGLEFTVAPSELDEQAYLDHLSSEEKKTVDPQRAVVYLAEEKSYQVAKCCKFDLVLAADTLVVTDAGETLGKPADIGQAERMLTQLAGRKHRVVTGVALRLGGEESVQSLWEITHVRMKPPELANIGAYLQTGEWKGKAGAYAIQGVGVALTEGIQGSYTNVVGLPLECLDRLFSAVGYSLWDFML